VQIGAYKQWLTPVKRQIALTLCKENNPHPIRLMVIGYQCGLPLGAE